MSVAIRAPFPVSRGAAIAMAALGPVAIGGILATRAHDPSPMFAAPAIVFGVIAATAPALYIATAAAGQAPPLAAVVRAFGVALGAFGIALAGLILPAAFASLSSLEPRTTIAVTSAVIAAAGGLGLRRLASELRAGEIENQSRSVQASPAFLAAASRSTERGNREIPPLGAGEARLTPSLAGSAVFLIWAAAIATIAGRLWWDLAVEGVS